MQKCEGCGMWVTDPLGHVAHGMAQITEVMFGGATVEEIAADLDELKMPALVEIATPLGIVVKPGTSKAAVREQIRAARSRTG